jgi:uncharacterized damage-inducible protein DinB
MNNVSLSGAEVLQWVDETSTQWFKFAAENPAILALPCDIMGVHTVAELLQHIVAVEVRYAQRLMGEEVTPYEQVPYGTVEELAATHQKAHTLFTQILQKPDYAWPEEIDFVTRSAGTIKATRRKVFFHANFHGIRHYAQLATLARQHGYKPGWMMDLMASRSLR